ncbi:hypothetical protein [Prosthecobacter sp.]|uniref:hypothetical protein n=1 Tax=Prosthecobacter sp. TaxID=1965333 RepID=UPI002AB86FC1|nr:hypothetical protein [Prosthecobacter sp.]MDZ4405386.1 hypothetical protein [Prosthecobacter sp.]
MNESNMPHASESMESPDPGIADSAASASSQSTHKHLTGNTEASNGHGAKDVLKQTAGVRLAYRSVASWYHGGINE